MDAYDVTMHYSLSSGAWCESSGTGSASGSGASHFSYSGGGSYWPASTGQTMRGTFTENGADHSTYDYETHGSYTSASGWVATGVNSASVQTSGNNDYTYSGNGVYQPYGLYVSATGNARTWNNPMAQESGNGGDSYDYTTYYAPSAEGEWQTCSGSGSASQSFNDDYSYSADGTYYRDDCRSGVNSGVHYRIQGTLNESGHATVSGDGTTTSEWINGEGGASGYWATSGDGYSYDDRDYSYSYSGQGDYTSSESGGYSSTTISSRASENGNGHAEEHHVSGLIFYSDPYDPYGEGSWDSYDESSSKSGSCTDSYSYTGLLTYTSESLNTVQSRYNQQDRSLQYTSADDPGSSSGAGTATYSDTASDRYTVDTWSKPSFQASNHVEGYVNGVSWYSGDLEGAGFGDTVDTYGTTGISFPPFLTAPYFWPGQDLPEQQLACGSEGAFESNDTVSLPGVSRFDSPSNARSLAISDVNFDPAHRLTSFTDANGGVTALEYHAGLRPSSLTDPAGNTTTWSFDAKNRPTQETDALGASRYFVYDDAGYVVRYTDRNGRVRDYEFDAAHRVTTETWYDAGAGDGGLETGESDPIPNSQSLIPAPTNTIHYEYDSKGRIIAEWDNVSSVTYAYNDAGQITSTTQTSAGGPAVTFNYLYDSAGRRIQMAAFVGSSADFVEDYVYDSLGRVASVHRHGGGLSQLSSDENGTAPFIAVADVRIDLAYDSAGRLASIDRYEDGHLAVEGDYSYDSLGRLVGLVYHQGDVVLNEYAWAYSGKGTGGSGQSDSSLTPNPQSLIPASWQPTGGLRPIRDTSYVTGALLLSHLADADLLTSCTSSDGTAVYRYDPTGQLTGAHYTSPLPLGEGKGEGGAGALSGVGGAGSASVLLSDESYTYDLNGNRLQANGGTYVIGPDNRLLSDGTYCYAYDAEGNRTARYIDVDQSGTLSTNDTKVTKYAWDGRNRLVGVADYAVEGGRATQAVDYLYDVENRWIGEDIDLGGDGVIDRMVRFAYDGNQIVLQFERDLSPLPPGEGQGEGSALTGADLSHRYLWQPNAVDQLMADEQLTRGLSQFSSDENGTVPFSEGGYGYDQTTAGTVVWPLADHLGTIRDLAVADAAAGATTGATTVANHRVYDSFGNLKSQTNAAVDCLFGFTGRAFDAATSLQNNWHRWYDAAVGEWISKDWMGFTAGDANTYRYVGNRSTSATDPTGLAEYEWHHIVAQWYSNYTSYGDRAQGLRMLLSQEFHTQLHREIGQLWRAVRSGNVSEWAAYNSMMWMQLRMLPQMLRDSWRASAATGASMFSWSGGLRAAGAQLGLTTWTQMVVSAAGCTVILGEATYAGMLINEYGELSKQILDMEADMAIYENARQCGRKMGTVIASRIYSELIALMDVTNADATAMEECKSTYLDSVASSFCIQYAHRSVMNVTGDYKAMLYTMALKWFPDLVSGLEAAGCRPK